MLFQHILKDMTIQNVVASIREYEQNEVPHIRKLYNYYNGKHKILDRRTTEGRPENNIVDNRLRSVADTYLGFINPGGIESTDQFLNDNITEIQDAVKDSVIASVGYTLTFYDEFLRVKRLYPTRAMVFRDTSVSHNVIGGCFWSYYHVIENGFSQEYVDLFVVDNVYMSHYNGKTLDSVTLVDSPWKHNVSGIPIIEWKITSHYDSVILPGISLQDALNMTTSSYIDTRESLADPFLMITGCNLSEESADGLIDGDKKILNIPLPDADAKYLTKPDSGSDVVVVTTDLSNRLLQSCNCPDFNELKSSSASGASIVSRCLPFINSCNQYRVSVDDSLKTLSEETSNFSYEWPSYWSEFESGADVQEQKVSNATEEVTE